jgi:hypothetical protein
MSLLRGGFLGCFPFPHTFFRRASNSIGTSVEWKELHSFRHLIYFEPQPHHQDNKKREGRECTSMSERGQHRGRGGGRGLSSLSPISPSFPPCSSPPSSPPYPLPTATQTTNNQKVITAAVEAPEAEVMKAAAEDTLVIASAPRKKTSSTWESTWTRRSASSLRADGR